MIFKFSIIMILSITYGISFYLYLRNISNRKLRRLNGRIERIPYDISYYIMLACLSILYISILLSK